MCILSVGRDCLTCPRSLGRNASLLWQVRTSVASNRVHYLVYGNILIAVLQVLTSLGEKERWLGVKCSCRMPTTPGGVCEEAAAPATAAFSCLSFSWNSSALAMMPVLYQGLDLTAPKGHCLPLPSSVNRGVSKPSSSLCSLSTLAPHQCPGWRGPVSPTTTRGAD